MNVAELIETQLLRERVTELAEANDALERERDAMQARAERAEYRLTKAEANTAQSVGVGGKLMRMCVICDQAVGFKEGPIDHAPDCPFDALAERGEG